MNFWVQIVNVTAFILLTNQAWAIDNDNLQKKLESTIENNASKLNVPGLSVAVVLEDGSSLTAFNGVASSESQIDVDDTHLFRVASVSKHLTAIMVMMLSEQGDFHLDDLISDYIELYDLPNKDKITIRQLLNHSAGVYDHINGVNDFFDIALIQPNKIWTAAEILSYPAQYGADFEPGTGYSYSNTGFYILGLLIEKITQRSFADAFEHLLTNPLAISDIFADDYSTTELAINGLADNERAYEYHKSAIGAAGNFVATPKALAQLIHEIYNNELLTQESITNLSTPSVNDSGYGLGTRLWTVQDVFHFGHTGTLGGYKSILMYLPEHKSTIVISANGYPEVSTDWWTFIDEIFVDVLNPNEPIATQEPPTTESEISDKSDDSSGGSIGYAILFFLVVLGYRVNIHLNRIQ